MKTHALNAPAALVTAEVESARVRRGPNLTDAYAALLDAVTGVSLEAGPAAVARRLLDCVASLLPERALGVCLVLSESAVPLVELALPEGMPPPGRDPTRLFPELLGERVLEFEGLPGSTLHAAPSSTSLEEDAIERAILQRAAAVMATSVRSAMVLRAAKPVSVEMTELRAQLIQAQKLSTLGQIVAGVVHELANPVTSIVASTELLMRSGNGEHLRADETQHLQRIRVAADRILKFSRDLVQYARPAREAIETVSLADVITQAHAFSQHEFERYGIVVEVSCAESVPKVRGRAGPLTQVFVNLFTNAAHAMSDHGGRLAVTVREEPEQSRIAVEVTDTGTGIHPDTLTRIFEPFFTTKETGRGTGLGLAIVKEIVTSHGGTVGAASTPGEGTSFTVHLPLPRADD
ncbi:MAG TPA: ATP-binding protein [Polyangiaceae bacterium]|nr:ATP-binding protein [Polyangiaceae bacterium]